MEHTLSFCILDDLIPCHGPCHITFSNEEISYDTIAKYVNTIIKKFKKNPKKDQSNYFDEEFFKSDNYISKIIKDLLNKGFFVCNRYNKYYVIAFSLDYVRFEIFSKDCDKELIKWRYYDKNDPINGKIIDADYNENPVVKIFKNLQLLN